MQVPKEKIFLRSNAVSLRFTLRGWIFGFLSILIGSVGVYRKELASILWGIGMGSIWVFSLLFSTGAAFLLFRRRYHLLKHLEFAYSKENLYAGKPITFSVSLPKEVLQGVGRVPGILLWYRYRVSAFQERVYQWKVILDPRHPSIQITPPSPLRGAYMGSVGILQVEDCFRFCQIDIPLPEEEHLLVLPEPAPPFPLPNLKAQGGTRHREQHPTYTTLEELEIRKYIPGDDPRRLHWKLYAHSGELFLRIGEQDPPPMDTFHLHFDPTLPTLQDPIHPLEAVDRMASIGARVLLDLSQMGNRIFLSTNQPNTMDPLSSSNLFQTRWFQPPWIEMEGGHPEEGLAELAKLSPYPFPEKQKHNTEFLNAPSVGGRIVFLFEGSLPSQKIQQILSVQMEKSELEDGRFPLEVSLPDLGRVFFYAGEYPLWVILIHPLKGMNHG